jgi:hypothetical protein
MNPLASRGCVLPSAGRRRDVPRVPQACLAAALLTATGCFNADSLLESQRRERQLWELSAIDLGRYQVNLPRLPGESRGGMINFRAFGKVANRNFQAARTALDEAGPLLHHKILASVRQLPSSALEEPDFQRLRACVSRVVNETVGEQIVESVGLSDFTYSAL